MGFISKIAYVLFNNNIKNSTFEEGVKYGKYSKKSIEKIERELNKKISQKERQQKYERFNRIEEETKTYIKKNEYKELTFTTSSKEERKIGVELTEIRNDNCSIISTEDTGWCRGNISEKQSAVFVMKITNLSNVPLDDDDFDLSGFCDDELYLSNNKILKSRCFSRYTYVKGYSICCGSSDWLTNFMLEGIPVGDTRTIYMAFEDKIKNFGNADIKGAKMSFGDTEFYIKIE